MQGNLLRLRRRNGHLSKSMKESAKLRKMSSLISLLLSTARTWVKLSKKRLTIHLEWLAHKSRHQGREKFKRTPLILTNLAKLRTDYLQKDQWLNKSKLWWPTWVSINSGLTCRIPSTRAKSVARRLHSRRPNKPTTWSPISLRMRQARKRHHRSQEMMPRKYNKVTLRGSLQTRSRNRSCRSSLSHLMWAFLHNQTRCSNKFHLTSRFLSGLSRLSSLINHFQMLGSPQTFRISNEASKVKTALASKYSVLKELDQEWASTKTVEAFNRLIVKAEKASKQATPTRVERWAPTTL